MLTEPPAAGIATVMFLVVTTGGAAKCWGYNGWGQIGDNSLFNRPSPVDVSGLASGVTAIGGG